MYQIFCRIYRGPDGQSNKNEASNPSREVMIENKGE